MNRLRMLRQVAERKTIASAAEALFMTPSAVSQQLAVLEREAGVALLERSGRGVRLTGAGETLVANTERILAALEQAEADLVDASRGIIGHVRVSAFPSAARAILVPALVKIRDNHPNLRVSMVDLEPEEAIPALKARDLDIALTYEWDLLPSPENRGVVRERLFAEPVYLAIPSSHPLAASKEPVPMAQLSDAEWIVGRDSTSMLEFVRSAAHKVGFEPMTDFHSMDIDVILAAVDAGLGVALVPPLALMYDTPGVAIRRLADLSLNRIVWAAVRMGSGDNPAIGAVLDTLRTQAATAARGLRQPD